MEITETEVSVPRREHRKLLCRLKATAEGLLSTDDPKVWSRYGGLERLHKDMHSILSHGLKQQQACCKQKNYWPFVWCVRYICPDLAFHVEQFGESEPEEGAGCAEGHQAERWLLHSLQERCLSAQLRPLLKHQAHTRKYYRDGAFVLTELPVSLMLQCLEAVEHSDQQLLALVDTLQLSPLQGAPCGRQKSHSLCLFPGPPQLTSESEQRAPPSDGPPGARPAVPQIWLTGPASSPQGPAGEGQTHLSVCKAPPSRRPNSYPEGQSHAHSHRRHAHSLNRHTRSLSDTSATLRLRNEWDVEDFGVKGVGLFSRRPDARASSLTSEASWYSSGSDGMLAEGQNLLSYLTEWDIERENAHFSISEALISVLELLKWRLGEGEEDEEEDGHGELQLLKKMLWQRNQLQHTHLHTPPAFPLSDSGGSGQSSQESLLSDSPDAGPCGLTGADFKLSVPRVSRKYSLSSESLSPPLQSNSAEAVALGLLRQFETAQLEGLSLQQEAAQLLLGGGGLAVSSEDAALRSRAPESPEWAPPRPQIILHIHPAHKRSEIVSQQSYLCAGCGTPIDPGHLKRLRYCQYLGRYFCRCCHDNAQVVLPARVVRSWDFSRHPVCNFARDLLSAIAAEPLFNVSAINSGLYKKVRALETVRLLRVQLFQVKNMLKTCRLAEKVLGEFDTLPDHLTEDLHLFSLDDLGAVRRGELVPQLRELLRLGSAHVAGCELCKAKGFVCEFCGSEEDVVFPLELRKCQRCGGVPPLLAGGPGPMETAPAQPWRIWKFHLPGQLARVLSQERRSGEGEEEDDDGEEGDIAANDSQKEEKRNLGKMSHSQQTAREEGEGGEAVEEGKSHTEKRRLFLGGLAKVFSRDRGESVEGEPTECVEEPDREGRGDDPEGCQRTAGEDQEGLTRKSVFQVELSSGKFWKTPKPIKLPKMFFKERRGREGAGSGGEGQAAGPEEAETVEPARGASGWRSLRTRKARRFKSGRKREDSSDRAGAREGGEEGEEGEEGDEGQEREDS